MQVKQIFIWVGLVGVLTQFGFAEVPADNLTAEQRIGRLENQVQYLNGVVGKVDTLSQQVTQLTAELNQMQQILQKTQVNQQSINYLEQRVMALEATRKLTTPAIAEKPAALQQGQVADEEQAAYQKAYNDLLSKDYDNAIKAFNHFVHHYPKSSLLADAYYWLGELYLTEGQPDLATQQLRIVIGDKQSDKRSQAMLTLGTIYLANGDSAHAKETFEAVIHGYPNTAEAKQAAERIKSMG